MPPIRVWAPEASTVSLRIDGVGVDTVLQQAGDGWWVGPVLGPGIDYGFVLDDAQDVLPDPLTRRQPQGVHGLSRSYDHDAFTWHDQAWQGRDLRTAIVYELHIGTFTHEGTFDAAIERLTHLVDLGVTHVEVLPVNAVNGNWNWGYDGVDWYAVHEPIGGPDGFKGFVDAAHAVGLAVLLDAVYNHFGPSGNYLPKFGPYLKTGRSTWGDLVNLEERAVRDYILDNAAMWLRDFHLDGLRLDAVHALQDDSPTHILAELSQQTDNLSQQLGRPLTLIAESDLNDAAMITPLARGGLGMTAQWDDDVHHVLHSLLTGETQGYYVDFDSMAALAKTFTSAFLHDGTYSTFRGRVHGAKVNVSDSAGWQFVVCLQDHDQVGNRAVGDRLPEITSTELLRVGAVLLLTSPFTPMLWMGEEWAASSRWPFFTSHPEPELAEATAKGRVAEFSDHGWDTEQMLDPQDPRAFADAKLRWDEIGGDEHASMLALYRELIALRASEPDLRDPDLAQVAVAYDEDQRWAVIHRGTFRVAVNLADAERRVPVRGGEIVLVTGSADPGADGLRLGAQSAAVLRV